MTVVFTPYGPIGLGNQIIIRRLPDECRTRKKADSAISRVIRTEEFTLRPDGFRHVFCRWPFPHIV